MSSPSWTSLTPPTPFHSSRLSQSTWFELPASYSEFLLAIYFKYGYLYVSMLLSQFLSLLYCVHKALLHVFNSIAALQIGSLVPSF